MNSSQPRLGVRSFRNLRERRQTSAKHGTQLADVQVMSALHTGRRFSRLSLFLVLFFLSSFAQAQESIDSESGRLRLGLAGGFVVAAGSGYTDQGSVSAGTFTPNLVFDVGVQANRQLAVYAHLMAGTLLLTSHGAAHAIVEYTPLPWLSLGTGVGYEAYYLFVGCGCSNNAWQGFSVPLIAGFNIGGGDAWNARERRTVFRINAEGSAGVDANYGVWGGRGTVSFGAAWM